MKRRVLKTVKPRRKWRRRVAWGVGGLVLALLAVPFVFTGALVRFYLAHSEFRDVPVRFRTATLSPTGRLTVYDLEVDDSAESAGKRLLFAEQASVSFNWLAVWSGRVQSVQLEHMELWVHPGKEVPATLLRLAGRGDTGAGSGVVRSSAAVASGGAGGGGFWWEALIVTGHVRFADYDPWMGLVQVKNNDPLPVHLVVHSTGTKAAPVRDVSLLLGDADIPARPFLTSVFKVQAVGDETLLTVDRLHVGNLSPVVTESLAAWWPGVPAGGHFERLILSGTLAVGREVSINASAELRDFSARGGAPAGGLAVEHLSAATHVEGKLSATPLKDLKFTRSRCAWDTLEAGDWKLQKGVADFQVEGTELVLSDLQAEWAETHVAATAAYDLSTGVLTRGRIWTGSASTQRLREKLPAAWAAKIPAALEGNLTARVFLNESDREHLAAYVEMVAPDGLTFNVPGAATAPATGPARWSGAQWPGAVLSNGMISGTVSWNLRPDTLPEISHGRLTADQLLVLSPAARGREGGTAFNRIKSDFNLSGNMFRLDDFYADLPGNGRLALEGNYALEDGSAEEVVLSLNGVDLALANAWLPPGWSLSGQADGEWHGNLSARAAGLDGSLGLGPQVIVSAPAGGGEIGKMLVAGGTPVVTLRFAMDRRSRVTQIQAAEISGVGAMQVDPGFMRALRDAAAPAPGGAGAQLLERMSGGGFVSFDKIGVTGHVGPAEAVGVVNFSGLDLGGPEAAAGASAGGAAGAEKIPALLNLTLKAEVSAGLLKGYEVEPASVKIAGGQFLAERMTLGQNSFTEISGNFSAGQEHVYLTRGALSVAEGTVEGDLAVRFDGSLEALHLGFTGLHQQTLWRNLYPEVFTAEGPVSGKLTLLRRSDERLVGAMELTADGPGRLKITREASAATFGQAAKAALADPSAVLPENFQAIVVDQLADYPYVTGKASLTEDAGGLHLKLDYARQPLKEGEPGYGVPVKVQGQEVKANVEFQLRGGTVTLRQSVVELVEQFLGF